MSSPRDEQPGKARPEKIPSLKPAFRDGGTVTAANSSSISDGAAALGSVAQTDSRRYRARILGHASHAQAPGWFTTAPVPAAQKLLAEIGWAGDDVDLWEVNEAFAVVPMAFMQEMGIPPRYREREWRGLCAGPSDRRFWRADHRDAAECAGNARAETWRCGDLHRWRRRHGDRDRAGLERHERYSDARGL